MGGLRSAAEGGNETRTLSQGVCVRGEASPLTPGSRSRLQSTLLVSFEGGSTPQWDTWASSEFLPTSFGRTHPFFVVKTGLLGIF